ncbi:MAG: PAS domain S-box protein, partial [Methanospirillum sp.]|uniref:PAS domain S-box protein n=1 Tax=Methanospirillum sp. TaxID=45200 RepID=UPI00236AEDA4
MIGEIHALYVDDEEDLLTLGKVFLERLGDFTVTTVPGAARAIELLSNHSFDVIISDYQMPKMDGIEFLKTVRSSGNSIPFILFTGKGRETVVIQALNEGADFYVQKGGDPQSQFVELVHKVRQSVTRRRLEASVSDHERREADIINFLPDATFAIDTDGMVIAWNRAMEQMTGVKAQDIVGKGDYEYALPFYLERRPILIDLILKDDPGTYAQYPTIKREGVFLSSEKTLPHFHDRMGVSLWFTASPLYDNQGTIVGAIESIRDITESKRAEEALRLDESRLEALLKLNLMIGDSEHDITEFALNEAVRLTQSTIGYIAFVSEDESVLTMYSWSKGAMQECQVQEKPLIYLVVSTGLWGEAIRQRRPIITNDYDAESPLKRGTPQGHVRLIRHLGVPVFDADRIVIVAGVGNKSDNYSPSDIRQIELLMGGMWTILQRKRAELTLLRNYEELHAAYEEISATEEELRSNLDEITRQGEKLLENEHQLHAMASNIPGVVYRFCIYPDGKWNFTYISERSREILGIDNDPATFDDRFTEGLIVNEREKFRNSILHAIRTKTLWEFEGQYTKPSGEIIWLNAFSSPSMEYGNLIFDGVIFNDTDRKQKSEFLQLLAHISDESPSSITIHDFDGTMLYANDQTFRLHGYTREEFLAKNLHEIDVPESEQLIAERAKQILETGAIDFDVQHFRKDGSILPLHTYVKIIEWKGKKVLLSIAMDRSERIRSEEALHEANQKFRLLTGLTRHDILNQLSVVRGFQLLAMEESDPAIIREYISRAQQVGERIERTIEFTKKYEEFGIASSGWQRIHAVIDSAKDEVSLNGFSILNHIPKDLEIYADPIIRKVFATLL